MKLLWRTVIVIFFSLFALYSLISGISVTKYMLPSLLVGYKTTATHQKNTTIPADFEKSNNASSRKITSARSKNKLEFVHISKTGGSAVETLAGRNGIVWGACHYSHNRGLGCFNPDKPWPWQQRSYTFNSPWHTPPKVMMRMFNSTHHFYFANDNNDSSSSSYNKNTVLVDLFAVIRNPYTRMVSEYYCPFNGNKNGTTRNNPTVMNQWIMESLTTLSNANNKYRDLLDHPEKFTQRDPNTRDPPIFKLHHFINCAEYVFDYDGRQIVQHVIHYENLKEEFDQLMKEYGIDLTLPRKEEGAVNKRKSTSQLTYLDLSPEAIAVINNFARDDFEKFGYTMVTQFQKDANYSEFAVPTAATSRQML